MQVMGQIFIPEVNYLMMVLTVIVVAIFQTTTQLGNAYGDLSFTLTSPCAASHLQCAVTSFFSIFC